MSKDLLIGVGAGGEPLGQVLFTPIVITEDLTVEWVVPPEVYFISAVAVGGGGTGAMQTSGGRNGAGGGGGLSWRNNIPVTPGEVLIINAGKAGRRSSSTDVNGDDGGDSGIYRDDEVLLLAGGGKGFIKNGSRAVGGLGGKSIHSINDGGGTGGDGGWHNHTNITCGGGGAGGYSGNGGRGGASGTAIADYYAKLPQTGSGGGGGGGPSSGGASATEGGAVGIFGKGRDGTISAGVGYLRDGSKNDVPGYTGIVPANRLFGAGSLTNFEPTTRAKGAVRIIWGEDRYFPDTNTIDM